MNCPICSGTSYAEWGKIGVYSILTCTSCGCGITSPFPSGEDMRTLNREIYQVDRRIKTYLSRKRYFEKRYRSYITNIKHYKKEGTLLDVGCNIGLFLKVARDAGYAVTGVELNRECASYGKTHFDLNIYTDHLSKIGFPDGSFDVVTLFDILEHIPDIHAFISETRRILKNDGVLVLQSPNINSLMAKLTGAKWYWLTPPDHLYHFTPDTLEAFLKSHNFSLQKITTWEPAQDFSNNFLAARVKNSVFRKMLLGINYITNIFTFPIFIIQRLWWRRQRGGLIELYAVKAKEAR